MPKLNNKLFARLLLTLIAFTGCSNLRIIVNSQADQTTVRKIAVLGFEAPADEPNGGNVILADIFSTELLAIEYNVLERSQLQRIIDEQKLSTTGLLNEQDIAQVGKLLGVQGLVIGTVSGPGNNFKKPKWVYSVKMVNVQTAEIMWNMYGTNLNPRRMLSALKRRLKK